MYRMFYFKYTYHRGIEYKEIQSKIINNLKDARKYNIYYLTDLNGNVIIDNRKGEENEENN